MKAVTHLKKILLAVAAAVTLIGASSRVEMMLGDGSPTQTIRVKCAGNQANLILEIAANGQAKLGVEKRVNDRLQFKMVQPGSMKWFESNAQIWINDQIRIDLKQGKVAIFANTLPTDFAVDHRLCEEII